METGTEMATDPAPGGPAAPALILASTSASRQAMLTAAGVPFEAIPPRVDEDELKASLKAQKASPRAIADALAETKALKISSRIPGALVLGCDQVLSFGKADMLDKPRSLEEARQHLEMLRGQEHKLISAAVIAQNGQAVWRFVDTATLTMRAFTPEFLDDYLAHEGEAILGCVGCYRLEGRGAQLFSRINGDFFTILGLPLLAVLDYLRERKVLIR